MSDDFREPQEILVLKDEKGWKEGTRSEIRVVRWFGKPNKKNANPSYIRLEKREFYIDKATGKERMGKAQGFSIYEIDKVIEPRLDEIKNVMKNPPPAPPPPHDTRTDDLRTDDAGTSDPGSADTDAQSAAPLDDEEVPF